MFGTIALWGLSIGLITTDPLFAVQKKQANSSVTQPTNAASFEDYKKECLQRATQEGLPKDIAEDLCQCTMTQFRQQYSIDKFRELVRKSKTDKNAQRTLSNVGESCFEEILYE